MQHILKRSIKYQVSSNKTILRLVSYVLCLIFMLIFSAPHLFSQEKKDKSVTIDSIQINPTTLKIIEIIHLDSTINTKYPEFGQIKLKDSLLFFTSSRPDASENVNTFISMNYVSRIFESKRVRDKWRAPAEFISEVNLIGTDNADICFTRDHKKIYFSRAETKDNPDKISSIYSSIYKKGKWQKPQKLGGKINLDNYTSTQPAVATLEDGNEILYFVSDRTGGMGKKDIWYTVLLPDGKYTDPVNLGPPVNSSGDDKTPYYHQASGTLYFSSDGHNGLGGFDIFKSKGFKNTWKEPVNLGAPFNTIYDEMYYTVNETDTNGYFTSNRTGSFYNEKDTCCKFDIYEYQVTYIIIPPSGISLKDTGKQLANSPLERGQRGVSDEQHTTNNKLLSTINYKLSTITLFFDNDYPDPVTNKIYTDHNYLNLLKDYINKREEYIKQYSGNINSSLNPQASNFRNDINVFFDDKVVNAENRLKEFSEQLMTLLHKGCNISLEIGGYCSPLFTSPYNYNLSQRRISSFIVYLCHYNNGEFIKYFHPSDDNIGKLSFILKPEGRDKAPVSVSQDPHDIRNSVYSPSASSERKLIITPIINSCP
jgi:hypothetical protein